MEAVIALFILIAAITFSSSEPSVKDSSFTQSKDAATQELAPALENDVSVCIRPGVQVVERDLSGPKTDRFSAHD
jgi:hypothetical protein